MKVEENKKNKRGRNKKIKEIEKETGEERKKGNKNIEGKCLRNSGKLWKEK